MAILSSSPLGESGPALFPVTAWTVVLEAAGKLPAARARAMERLAAFYWRPIYWTLRRDWGYATEDASDLVQEYFSLLLEESALAGVDREKGSFRSWVKATLKHFVLNRKRFAEALRRGGNRRWVSLEDLADIEQAGLAHEESPERLFERELLRSLVVDALRELRTELESSGKSAWYELFHTYYLEESAGRGPRYSDLAGTLAVGEGEIRNRLARVRARFRMLVLARFRDGVRDESALLDEIREVAGS